MRVQQRYPNVQEGGSDSDDGFLCREAPRERGQDGQASSLELAPGFWAIEPERIKRRHLMKEPLLRARRRIENVLICCLCRKLNSDRRRCNLSRIG
jgi:hypothetical protein